MKTRIITGVSCALFAIALLVFTGLGFKGVMSIPMAILSAIACWEVMRVSKCKNKVLTVVSMIFSAVVPVYIDFDLARFIPVPATAILIIYIIAMLLIMLKCYDITRFEHVALALFASIIVPLSLSTMFGIRSFCEKYPEYFQRSHCVFFILCCMYCAWMSDTWAYFIGRKFGKHKLAPKISPKKSVEGAIAGLFGTTLFCVVTYFICDRFYFHIGTVSWWMVALGAIYLGVMGMCGDLSASVIKRNFGEKDFGNLFPGHGGVLDRIDSFLFTLPCFYCLITIIMSIAVK